jgi:hypothetical protein
MPEHEVGGARAVYDYETEDPRLAGRRRRTVADWGVGEEMFEHMPRRRFARTPEPPRRAAHVREYTGATAVNPEPAPAPVPVAAPPASPRTAPPARPAARIESPDGRRTIVIGQRSRQTAVTPRPARPRTAADRLGHRPDRIAMWAVAMGLLLILIAVLSAHG